jgi:hypothetical protein
MDTFVVRVYSSGPDGTPDGDRLRGVVEEISTGLQATFHDAAQLLSILCRRQRDESGVSPQRGPTPRAIAMPTSNAQPSAVHHHSSPFPTKGGPNDPGQRQTS